MASVFGDRETKRTGQSIQRLIKRLLDVGFSGAALVGTSPAMLAATVLVRSTLGRPVLFQQKRIGEHGRCIKLSKFRTMTNQRDSSGALLPDDERVTFLGRVLRATAVDELPQLLSVLKGEMSIIGPRPLPLIYLERYNQRQIKRHSVPPGLTGWVQANFRGKDRSWAERLEQDVWYVENWNLLLDAKIFLLTFYTFLFFRLLYDQKRFETATVPFMGNKESRGSAG